MLRNRTSRYNIKKRKKREEVNRNKIFRIKMEGKTNSVHGN